MFNCFFSLGTLVTTKLFIFIDVFCFTVDKMRSTGLFKLMVLITLKLFSCRLLLICQTSQRNTTSIHATSKNRQTLSHFVQFALGHSFWLALNTPALDDLW